MLSDHTGFKPGTYSVLIDAGSFFVLLLQKGSDDSWALIFHINIIVSLSSSVINIAGLNWNCMKSMDKFERNQQLDSCLHIYECDVLLSVHLDVLISLNDFNFPCSVLRHVLLDLFLES